LRFSYSGGEKLAYLSYLGPEVSFTSGYGEHWYPRVIDGSDRGAGLLKISVPAGETAIADGDKRSSPEEEAQGTFLFEITHPDYFSFASGKYKTVRRNGRLPLSVYLLSDRENMLQYLDEVAKIFDQATKSIVDRQSNRIICLEVNSQIHFICCRVRI